MVSIQKETRGIWNAGMDAETWFQVEPEVPEQNQRPGARLGRWPHADVWDDCALLEEVVHLRHPFYPQQRLFQRTEKRQVVYADLSFPAHHREVYYDLFLALVACRMYHLSGE
jgi:hypothetical protein